MLTRRTFIAGILAAAAAPAAQAADHPSVIYMRRLGTTSAFARVVQRHADLPEISNHALGKYAAKLQTGQRGKYQRGVATYMARYFALQSRDFTVAKYDVGDATVDSSKDVIVETKVFLMTGQNYNVAWRLVWRNGRYKVRDVRVLGFWLTNFQRSDFVNYLDKRNGDINKLIVALSG
jgi:phospholipid transport system substrate-binding protein